jgi:tetratricopeptide (TPR) repeat protein
VQYAAIDSTGREVRLLGWGSALSATGGLYECGRRDRSGRRRTGALLAGLLLLPFTGAGAWQPPPDAPRALRQAALLVQQGRLTEADEQARLALADPETQAAACSVLGTIRLRQHRLEESAALLEKAIALEPRLVGAHLTLAQVHTLQGNPERALGLYRRVLDLDSGNAAARIALARAETDNGNHQRSLEIARPALSGFRQSPDGLFVLVVNHVRLGHREPLAGLTRDWVQLGNVPQEWTVRFALALASGGAADEAVIVLEHARRTGPPSFELAFNLAGAYLMKADAARALESYDLALTLKPESVQALQQAAAVAEQDGQLERSLSYWMRARARAPDDPAILLGFGRVCLRMDLLDDAEPALTRAASLRPDEPAYQYTLAAARVGKRQFEAAQALLERLIEQRPEDAQLQYALGSILYIQGHLAEAAERLRASIRLQPDQLASPYYLALVVRDQGHDAGAIEMLEKLLRRYPDHAPSCEALGALLMGAQRYDEAERLLRNAIRLNAKSVRANYQLGLLLSRTGRRAEAERQLELAKGLRQEEAATSRLQLRLLDPEKAADRDQ